MIRVTDWLDLVEFANEGQELITQLAVNEKHLHPEDHDFVEMMLKPPFNLTTCFVSPFLDDAQHLLMVATTNKGTILVDEHLGFLHIQTAPLWNFVPASA